MWDYVFGGIAFMLVIEGILPFLCPNCWRNWATKLMKFSDQTMRLAGFSMMLAGLILLYCVNFFYGEL